MKTACVVLLCAAAFAQVPFERIVDADQEPGNWLTYSRNYQGHRFSPLAQITGENVERLRQTRGRRALGKGTEKRRGAAVFLLALVAADRAQGLSWAEIAREMGVGLGTVQRAGRRSNAVVVHGAEPHFFNSAVQFSTILSSADV